MMDRSWNEQAFPSKWRNGLTIHDVATFVATISVGAMNAHPECGAESARGLADRARRLADAVLAELGYVDGDGA